MLSSALRSAVTFTATSQHALCLPWVRAAVCCAKCPWVWRTTLYLRREAAVPADFSCQNALYSTPNIEYVSWVFTSCMYEIQTGISTSSSFVTVRAWVRAEDGTSPGEDRVITMPRGSQSLSSSIWETSYLKPIFPHQIQEVSQIHFRSFKDLAEAL